MPIDFVCPACGHQTQVADQFAGQSGPCVQCGQTIVIPVASLPGSGAAQSELSPAQVAAKKNTWKIALGVLGAVFLAMCCGYGLIIALLLPAVQEARRATRRTLAINNAQQICLALEGYYAANGHFPPAYIADDQGRPLHSWRVLILPYLEQQGLFEQYHMDEPWNGPNNSRLAAQRPDCFRHPNRVHTSDTATDFFLITGPGTLFDGEQTSSFEQITDGASSTLLVVESSGSEVNWLEPRDLNVETLSLSAAGTPAQDLVGSSQGVVIVGFADGSVRAMPYTISPEVLRGLITPAGGENVPVDF